MSRSLPVILALAVLSLAVADPAHAYLITVNFTATADPADPAGGTASGSFSFDSSIIPVGGFGDAQLDLSGLDFTWHGTTWTDANTNFYNLFFFNGTLVGWSLYGLTDIAVSTNASDPDDFWLHFNFQESPYRPPFEYHDQGTGGVFTQGEGTFSSTTSTVDVPEPGALALFGPGLFALGLIRRRKS